MRFSLACCCALMGAAATAFAEPRHHHNRALVEDGSYSVLIAAPDYDSMFGVEVTMDTSEGIPGLTSLDAGDSASYAVEVPKAGTYQLDLHLSSPDGEGSLVVGKMETQETLLTIDSLPATGVDGWTTLQSSLTLPAGAFSLQIGVVEPGWSLLWLSLSEAKEEDDGEEPTVETISVEAEEDVEEVAVEETEGEEVEEVAVEEEESEEEVSEVEDEAPAEEEEEEMSDSESSMEEEDEMEEEEEMSGSDSSEGMEDEDYHMGLIIPPMMNDSATMDPMPGFHAPPPTMEIPEGDATCFALQVDAVDYVDVDDIFDQATGDGTTFVGFIDPGDLLAYKITVPYASQYKMSVMVASPEGNGIFQVLDNETEAVLWEVEEIPKTADWETFDPIEGDVTLLAGEYTLRFNFTKGGFNLQGFKLEAQTDPTAFALDLSAIDDASAMEGVTIGGSEDSPIAEDLEEGSYVAFDVLIPADGWYFVDVRVNSPEGEGALELVHLPSTVVLETMTVLPITGGIETSSMMVELPVGCHKLAIRSLAPGWKMERVGIRYSNYVGAGVIPIAGEDYASMSGVFVQEQESGPSNLIFLDPGDYMIYEMIVPFAGTYLFEMWVASPSGEGAFDVRNLNTLERFTLFDTLPATGNWDTWEPARAELDLPAGEYSLMIRVVEGGANLQRFQLTRLPESQFWTSMSAVDYKYMAGGFPLITEKESYVGFLDPTDSVTYSLMIPAYGLYEVNLRVASPSGDGSLDMIRMDTMEVLTTINNLPRTGNWDKYDSSSTRVNLPPGDYDVMLLVVESGFNLEHIQIMSLDSVENGYELTVPASEFSMMEGVMPDENTTDVMFEEAGGMVHYKVLVPADGYYYMEVRTASPLGEGGFEVMDPATNGTIASVGMLPVTEDFDRRESNTIATKYTAGVQDIVVKGMEGGWLLESVILRYTEKMMKDPMAALGMDIMVEDYAEMDGAAVLTDDDGMTSLGFLDAGDSVVYDVSLENAGLYKFEMWVASPGGEGAFELVLDSPDVNASEASLISTKAVVGPTLLATFDTMPRTGSWETWEAVGVILDLPAGSHTLTVNVLAGGANIQRFRLTSQPTLEDFSILYGASDFDALGGIYVEQGEIDNLSFLDGGDFIAYTIMVPAYGFYKLNFRVAGYGNGAFNVTNKETGEVLGTVESIPSTNNWQNYEIVSTPFTDEAVKPGLYSVLIDIAEGGFNFQSLELVAVAGENSLDYDLAAADYSIMEGIGVETTDPLVTGETLAPGMEIVTTVGFLDPGDFIAYELIFPATETYYVDMVVTSPSGTGAFDLVVLPFGTVLKSIDTMPSTEDWSTYTTLSFAVTIPVGYHTLAISVVTGGFNLQRIRFYTMESTLEPGVLSIDATEYSGMDGVEVVEEAGMSAVAAAEEGAWMTFAVSIPFETPYKLEMLVSSPSGEGGFQLIDLRSFQVVATVETVPVTGSFSVFEYTNATVFDLPDGDYSLMVRMLGGGAHLKKIKLTRQLSPEGLPIEILSSHYVMMAGGMMEETSEGEIAITSLEPGNFLAYEVEFPAAGTYSVDLRVASPTGEGALDVVCQESGEILASVESIPNTGGFEDWDFVTVDITVEAGAHVFMLSILEGGFNYERLQISVSSSTEDFELAIDAGDFSEMEGVEVAENSDGSVTVSSLEAGDFVAYDVIIPTTDTYYLDVRVGSPEGAGAFELLQKSTETVLATVEHMPITKDEQGRETISMAVTLPEGYQTLQVHVLEEGWVLESLSVVPPPEPEVVEDAIEISAADYIASFGVQIQTPGTGIPHVAFLDAGDWLAYDLNIAFGGTYMIEIWVASPSGEGAFELVDFESFDTLGSLAQMPVTGNWETWESASVMVDFASGSHKIMLRVLDSGANLQRMKVTKVEAEGMYSMMVLPSEYYSLGGAYIQESEAGDVAFLSFLDPGDWVAFKVEIAEAGTYQMDVRVASPSGEGSMEILDMVSGEVLATVKSLPSSGDWSSFLAATTELELSPETQILAIKVVDGGFNMANMLLTQLS